MKTKSQEIARLESANAHLAKELADERTFKSAAAARSFDEDVAPIPSAQTPVSLTFTRPEDEHNIRVAVLAVSLMLKNRADASRVLEGSHVEAVIEDYARVSRLRELLGPVTDDELFEAVALWDETAE